jgi:hypothetical protein
MIIKTFLILITTVILWALAYVSFKHGSSTGFEFGFSLIIIWIIALVSIVKTPNK